MLFSKKKGRKKKENGKKGIENSQNSSSFLFCVSYSSKASAHRRHRGTKTIVLIAKRYSRVGSVIINSLARFLCWGNGRSPGSHEIVVATGTKFPEKVAVASSERWGTVGNVSLGRIRPGLSNTWGISYRSDEKESVRGNVCRTRAGIY